MKYALIRLFQYLDSFCKVNNEKDGAIVRVYHHFMINGTVDKEAVELLGDILRRRNATVSFDNCEITFKNNQNKVIPTNMYS